MPVSRTLLVAAFAIIYVVWGSTYLAIRVAVETLPPFLSAGARFFFAGVLMFLFLRQRGFGTPTRPQWRDALVTGVLLLLGGNGLVMWAERTVPSGLAALLVALTPVWFALLDWLRPHGKAPSARTIVGVVIGFVGVLMLLDGRGGSGSAAGSGVGPESRTGAVAVADARFGAGSEARPGAAPETKPGAGAEPGPGNGRGAANYWGAVAIMVAGISWAGGSLYSKHSQGSGSAWMNSAAQMICGGGVLLLAGVVLGEPWRTDWRHVSGRSIAALSYLVVFGSWIAFSAYVWLLKASTPSRVSTYAYVNPVIAVFLGWLLLGEKITPHMAAGAAVILAGVITITLPRKQPPAFSSS